MSDKHNASTSIKVLVRVRPLLAREMGDGDEAEVNECLVSMPAEDKTRVELRVPKTSSYHSQKNKVIRSNEEDAEDEVKKYKFDQCVWSYDHKDEHYTSNRGFYESIGPRVIQDLFQGFNMCLLAYGQTSSGKTYTMMGKQHDEGLIPLIVRDILRYKERLISERINCEVRISYMEIYNELVKDLLCESGEAKKCRVREHPIKGPYVENLNEYQIENYGDFLSYLTRGNNHRSTASTSMNDKSSRSHAIITLSLKQTKFTQGDTEMNNMTDANDMYIGDAEEEMISNIKLVDLAGSERLAKTKVFGQQDRMKEGSLINKSLTVLGRCINLLSSNSSNPTQKQAIVPYRDSTLSYILKENLSGNSKSFMIFCVSPIDFEESYQTLNYAKQVKRIKTAAKANKIKLTDTVIDWKEIDQSNVSIIDSLKDEVKELTEKLNALQLAENASSNSDGDKFSKLILYLEREINKVNFENKYLKRKLILKDSEVDELQNHVSYMDRELLEMAYENKGYKEQYEHTSNKYLVDNIIDKCNFHLALIESDLDEFDPRKVF
ncbi:uncharacterized protein AC631_02133 [Debaryomyces fabryi]|uniref:Kinesin motor domain-containing protein n=1 Tax=Debaryomyces fabryi TaxID=58627 RepID=A0A0V1Q0Y3_9ASCO|nr:uncharacterized protein AC631_02133 [Debaryomyces fabryi]KSA02137.1 hypothetical protein AC631_02133 [Debaryomyces fabryi]CUM55361.1 unnamed protein product [Debaryomyces fabryi]